jgi:alpha-tubulin suppressor-like RCC1 family protein
LNGIKAIAKVDNRSIALRNDGTIWIWGHDTSQIFGNTIYVSSNIPVQISRLTEIKAVIENVLGVSLDSTLD